MVKLQSAISFFFLIFTAFASKPRQLGTAQKQALQLFVQNNLKIDIGSSQKFLIKTTSNLNKYLVQIDRGRKKINMILQKLQSDDGQYKVSFMEEIAKFGNEKSFLRIKTSTGSKQQIIDENQKQNQQEIENNKAETQGINAVQKLLASELNKFYNIYELRVKKLILGLFPQANPFSIKFLDSNKENQYKTQVSIKGILHTVTVFKKLQNSQQILEIGQVTHKLSDK